VYFPDRDDSKTVSIVSKLKNFEMLQDLRKHLNLSVSKLILAGTGYWNFLKLTMYAIHDDSYQLYKFQRGSAKFSFFVTLCFILGLHLEFRAANFQITFSASFHLPFVLALALLQNRPFIFMHILFRSPPTARLLH